MINSFAADGLDSHQFKNLKPQFLCSMRVIKRSNLPIRVPISKGILLYLFLDNINAPGWVWGVVFGFYGIIFIMAIAALIKEDDVDILNSSGLSIQEKEKVQQMAKYIRGLSGKNQSTP